MASVNDYVFVRLTEHGADVVMRDLRKVADLMNKSLLDVLDTLYPRDAKGRRRFQMWELMNIFGPEMWMGNTKQVFEKNQIWYK